MEKLLYSVEETFNPKDNFGEKKYNHFNIPLYQRGYKWTPKDVRKLLEDIDNFNPSGNKFYCLQNITIVPKDDYFSVVDGQQRLTTLVILLSYLGSVELVKDKIKFPNKSIRKETNSFLSKYITNLEFFQNSEWDKFIIENTEYDHQDIYHIFHAHVAIDEWFKVWTDQKEGNTKHDFKQKLLENVKFIVNLIEESTSEEIIFGNLNSKRIPLDGADLVRAILITEVAKKEGERESDIKNIVRVNERRIKIGWELDDINLWWDREDVKNYFNSFINIKSEEVGGNFKLFNESKYPVNYLFLLYAEIKGKNILTLELFEKYKNNSLELYSELINLNNTLLDWFQDREIYHYLGFIFFNIKKTKTDFRKVWKIWIESITRLRFIINLKLIIKNEIFSENNLDDLEDDSINWYKDESNKLVQILVLMDIIYSLKENHSFLPYIAFTKGKNDIEHIFPQNPEEVEKKREYIEFLNTNVCDISNKFNLKEYDKRKNEEKYLIEMDEFINNQIKSIRINSIGNLVLLYESLNRSIGRNSYSIKRARIIEYFHKGNFIQPHTFQVFVRYFNNNNKENNDYEHWTNKDIKANASFIKSSIEKFIKDINHE